LKKNEVTVSPWTEYKKGRAKDTEMITKAKEKTLVQKPAFTAAVTPNSIVTGQPDEYDNAYSNRWITRLEQDLFLEEAFFIMCDFINIVEKK
jgi:hypothetical protein